MLWFTETVHFNMDLLSSPGSESDITKSYADVMRGNDDGNIWKKFQVENNI